MLPWKTLASQKLRSSPDKFALSETFAYPTLPRSRFVWVDRGCIIFVLNCITSGNNFIYCNNLCNQTNGLNRQLCHLMFSSIESRTYIENSLKNNDILEMPMNEYFPTDAIYNWIISNGKAPSNTSVRVIYFCTQPSHNLPVLFAYTTL